MGFIKKNLVFSLSVSACILVGVAGAYLTFAQYSQISKTQKKIASKDMQLQSVRMADPAPSIENFEASLQNVADLRQQLDAIRTDLQRGSQIKVSDDGIRVMAGIQQYISDFSRSTQSHVNAEGEAAPIQLADNMAFGYEIYAEQASVPELLAAIPKLDKQRQVLSYALTQLIDSAPQAILKVERELLVTNNLPDAQFKESFQIDPAVSARVPGAIDTLAFRVTFSGYTDTLRRFLNNLAKFDLPIVVRGIQVHRPETAASKSKKKPTARKTELDDLFGAFAGSNSVSKDSGIKDAQKPVISENASRFTVTLEFIEITSTPESEEDPA